MNGSECDRAGSAGTSPKESVEELREELAARFHVDPATVRGVVSPYRICPLGAHVDHQLGKVTGMALDRGVMLAWAPDGGGRVRIASVDFPGEVVFELEDVPPAVEGDWGNYARGAVLALQKRFALKRGFVGVTRGRLGEGGLSSSAAIGVAYLLALEQANGLEVSADDNIELDREIENGYLGLRNGILDQASILLSRKGFLTYVDCSDNSHLLVPPGPGMPDYRILIAFSGLRKALVDTDYNRRVEECAAAARTLLRACGRPWMKPLLGNVSPEEYQAHQDVLTDRRQALRAAHFFTEEERVVRGVEAWSRGDLDVFGGLMTASGWSSIHQYECGAPPLIDLYEIIADTPGVYGGRFSGAGFRGCCVGLVQADQAGSAARSIAERYRGRRPELAAEAPVLVSSCADGAHVI